MRFVTSSVVAIMFDWILHSLYCIYVHILSTVWPYVLLVCVVCYDLGQ